MPDARINRTLKARHAALVDLLEAWRERLTDGRQLPGWACDLLEDIEQALAKERRS